MTLTEIRQLVDADQNAVDRLVVSSLRSRVELIENIGEYIVNSGGKRLRPLLVLLSALAVNYKGDKHIHLAAIIEFIHTATLLHDDVVDESTLRRGNETANAIWGDHSSVLVGDFLYSRAFQMLVNIDNMAVMKLMADTTNQISEGEVLQLLNVKNTSTSEADYFNVIECKTAILFAAACEIGAIINNCEPATQQALHDYGLNLGIAYQLADDVLDYNSTVEELGKNIGDDLAEGKPTLPLIYILEHGTEAQITIVKDAIENANADNIDNIHEAIQQSGAIDYCQTKMKQSASKAIAAIDILSDSDYKQALISLINFVCHRKS